MTNKPAIVRNEIQERELNPSIMNMIYMMAENSERIQGKRFDVIKKLIFCHENSLPYSLALTGGIFIVHPKQGEPRLGIEGTVIRSQLRRSDDYDYEIVESNDKGALVRILRCVRGEWKTEGEFSFTEEHAIRAGLINKDVYKSYPEIMYINRAIAMAQRMYAPDIFNQSVYINGEVPTKDLVEGEFEVHRSPEKRKNDIFDNYDVDLIAQVTEGDLSKLETSEGLDEVEKALKQMQGDE